MTKEETLFQRRLLDLANMADQRNIVLFSDFLSLNELNIYHSSKKELGFVTCRLFGGYEAAERQMIALYLMLFLMISVLTLRAFHMAGSTPFPVSVFTAS